MRVSPLPALDANGRGKTLPHAAVWAAQLGELHDRLVFYLILAAVSAAWALLLALLSPGRGDRAGFLSLAADGGIVRFLAAAAILLLIVISTGLPVRILPMLPGAGGLNLYFSYLEADWHALPFANGPAISFTEP